MAIIRFKDFMINESEDNNSPNENVRLALLKVKKRIESYFLDTTPVSEEGAPNFNEMGLALECCELDTRTALFDHLIVKFSDEVYSYNLNISVNIKEGVKETEAQLMADVKFKKYLISTTEMVGQISKESELDQINDEFIMDIKVELDDQFKDSDNDEDTKIEYE